MQQTRRPHIFVWGLSGHGQRASMPANAGERVMPIDIRLDRSLPAFTNCSLDDDPGTAAKLTTPREVIEGKEKKADPYDGDSVGQVNLYLYWRSEDIVDTPDRWEMTVGLTDTAPKDQCTVDITPRRLQSLKILPNQTYKWNNTCEGKVIQTGAATADKYGLVTIRGALVNKKTNRITISKRGD
jgi:hypothetical protein